MLDIGWTELLVIAIVLIVVVGPKDLPPMLRAFGKMTKRLRVMAGEFRQQFDEALREAELDDVRQTFSDAQKLNPVNSLKDALNPLRQMGNDIRSDLQNAAKPEPTKIGEPWKPEPEVKLPGEPPTFPVAEPATVTPPTSAETPASRDPAPEAKKPARKPRAAKEQAVAEAAPVDAAPKAKAAPRKKAAVVAETAAVAPEAVSAPVKKPASRKAAAAAAKVEPAAEKAAKPKKPAAKAKKTGDA
ncbi:Sec-independent protein translocase protein TatB [Rhizobium sp. C4]|uniref:Sec-independent protein translocase protein TatB n=1 Tax=Rhizobium sp. C4 TaxID=1349800 RepID=UPI001E3D5F35|nr:Sec-independent protein translocase protein TatB [Rhizobium sp. C4]MCD2171555.1 Sec-independent protein translocase protein TatB [Rhizobium sp. C4]